MTGEGRAVEGASPAAQPPVTPRLTGDSELEPEAARRLWIDAAQVMAAVGALLYGAGWIFLSIFYAEFDVTPEEVNRNFVFVVSRVGLLVLAASVVIGLTLIVQAESYRNLVSPSGRVTFATRTYSISILAAMVVMFSAGIVGTYHASGYFRDHAGLKVAILAGGIVLTLVTSVLFVLAMLKIGAFRIGEPTISIRKDPLLLAAMMLIAASIIGLSFVIASRLGNWVAEGNELSVVGFRIDYVAVRSIDNILGADEQSQIHSCLLYLGSNQSVHTLFDHRNQSTIRVPTEAVIIARSRDRDQRLEDCSGPNESAAVGRGS